MRDVPIQVSAPSQIARFLVLSYLAALSLGLAKGAKPSLLLMPFLEQPDATYLTGGLILSLTALVVFDVGRRLAAMVIALIFFGASYVTLVATGDLAGFWRDLALLGVLLVTTGVGVAREPDQPQDDREPDPLAHVQKIVSTPQMLPEPPTKRAISRFREDFDIVRQA